LNTSLPPLWNLTTVLGDKFNRSMNNVMRLFLRSCQFLRSAASPTGSFVPLYVDFLIDPNFAPVNLSHEGLTKAEAEIRL
jgi:hypothetical protein